MKFNSLDLAIVFSIGLVLGSLVVAYHRPDSITKYNAAVEYGWQCAKDGSTLKQTLDEMKHPTP